MKYFLKMKWEGLGRGYEMSLEKKVSWAEELEEGKSQSQVPFGGNARSPWCLDSRCGERVRSWRRG